MTEGAKEQDRAAGGTSVRVASWLAWALVALSVAMFVASGVLYVLARSAQFPVDWVLFLADWVLFLAFPIVGTLIAFRRPENPIGWICLAIGLLFMLLAITDNYSIYGVARPGSVPFPVAVGTIGNQWLWVPTVGLLGIYLILLFPDGKLPSKRWRPLAWFSGVMIVVLSITEGLAPGPLENQGGVRNPFGLEALPWLEDVANIVLPLLPICILASAVSMVLRFRRSRGEVRQQIKWFTFLASFAGLLYFIAMISQAVVVLGSDDSLAQTPLWFELIFSLAGVGFAGVPVAIGIAVLKYRLYDIDVVINLTLVYGSLTAMLALVYFGGVTATQTIFRALTGQEQQHQLAIVISTLVIAALFNLYGCVPTGLRTASRSFGNALSCGVHTCFRRSPRAGHGSSTISAPGLFRVMTDICTQGVDEPGPPKGADLGEIVRRACTKVQAENRPPARCICPLPAL